MMRVLSDLYTTVTAPSSLILLGCGISLLLLSVLLFRAAKKYWMVFGVLIQALAVFFGTSGLFAVASSFVGVAFVFNNSQLSGRPSTQLFTIARLSFATLGDSPVLWFYPSSSACTLNAGAGDGGSQVPSADGKCWLANFPAVLDARWWGASTNPITFNVTTTGSDGGGASFCLNASHPCLTIGQANTQRRKFNPMGGSRIILAGAGTFNENFVISGELISGNLPFLTAAASVPMDILRGAGGASCPTPGPTCTIIKGVNIIAGQSYCYTVLSQNGAVLGLQNIAVEGDAGGGSCGQSDLYAERDGKIYILSDVKLLAATGNLISEEDGARVWVNPGDSTRCALTLAGNAGGNGINIDSLAHFWSDSEICFANNPVFSGGYIFLEETDSSIKLFANPAVTSGATITGARYFIGGNSSMSVAHVPAVWPGTLGFLSRGGRYEGSDDVVCIGGAAGCPNVTAPTGFGVGATFSASGDPFGFAIQINTGTGPGSGGTLQVGFPYNLVSGVCPAPSLSNGTGSWVSGSTGAINSGFTTATGLTFTLVNGDPATPSAMTASKSYFATNACNSGG